MGLSPVNHRNRKKSTKTQVNAQLMINRSPEKPVKTIPTQETPPK